MNKATLKEGTKSNVIIIPGIISEEPRNLLKLEPTPPPMPTNSNDDFINISSFEGNVDQATNFYLSEITKLTSINSQLSLQLRRALQDKKELADMIASFEELSKDDTDEKKKRVRRCANEIQRKYICQVSGCEKSYGTEGSMAQHMKLKHP